MSKNTRSEENMATNFRGKSEREGDMLSYRYSQSPAKVGDRLPCSHVWDGDEPTSEELSGTCAFTNLADCQRYAQWSRGYILTIEGERIQSDADLPGGVIIRNAVVVSVEPWRL